jgi:hypothetical protein
LPLPLVEPCLDLSYESLVFTPIEVELPDLFIPMPSERLKFFFSITGPSGLIEIEERGKLEDWAGIASGFLSAWFLTK